MTHSAAACCRKGNPMQRPFRFGVVTTGASSRQAWVEQARTIEALGYASLLMPDRIGLALAPLSALASAAAATTTLRVGSYVFCNDYRHPGLLAHEIASLDLLSDGRLEVGIGAGAGAHDYAQLGIPFDRDGVRVARLAEALPLLTRLL